MAMAVGLLMVFSSVFLALAAPLIGLALIGVVAFFRARRDTALFVLRESVVRAAVWAAGFGILGWALAPYMVDALTVLTFFGMSFTVSSVWLSSKSGLFTRHKEKVEHA
jgi:hypothetical protein